jgi:large subunit ribosomal protein L4
MEINILNLEGKNIDKINFTGFKYSKSVNQQAIFDQIITENSGKRQGTHSTLTKGEVRGGGRKPRPQKHTGRARQGSIRNPQWPGGGIVFGPKPNRNYKKKLNKKVSRLAFHSALLEKIQNSAIYIIDDLNKFEKVSTKKILSFLKEIKLLNKKILFFLSTSNHNCEQIIKSTKNLVRITAKKNNQISVRDIVNANYILMDMQSFEEEKK